MKEHVCPACQRMPAKPSVAIFKTGPNWRKHYSAEVLMTCEVCDGHGLVSAEVLRRYHMGRAHRDARRERGETMFACAQRLGVTSAQLSAFEKGHKDLPVSADSAGSGE